jgi:hypothetical protein
MARAFFFIDPPLDDRIITREVPPELYKNVGSVAAPEVNYTWAKFL